MNLLFDLEGTLIHRRGSDQDVGEALLIAMLGTLKEQHRLFIITSKLEAQARSEVAENHLNPYFSEIVGRDSYPGSATKAETLAQLIEDKGLVDEECIIIGDRPHDMEAGRGNSICAIGVLWGNGSKAELLSGGADYLCENFYELQANIEFLDG